MATYTDSEKARIMSYPIASLLYSLGKRTDHERDMYYSPFRDETKPSLHINRARNIWRDFGDGTGGNVLTMACRLLGLTLTEAWDYVAGLDPNIVVIDSTPERSYSHTASSRIIIDKIDREFTLRRLSDYAGRRGIPMSVLSCYCREVTYHIESYPGERHTAIGFPSGDGWVLRSPGNWRGAKRCTSSAVTLLGPSGVQVSSAQSPEVEVFEGFFDFLSWLVLQDRTLPLCDVCVLNSTVNVGKALAFITGHRRVSCWLDNDKAGMDALAAVRKAFPETEDHLAELDGLNDVNDLLLLRRQAIVSNNSISHHSLTLKK